MRKAFCFLLVLFSMLPASPGPAAQADIDIVLNDPTGETIRALLGVNAGPYPSGEPGNKDLTREYKDLGVNMVRNHDFYGPLDMAQMYPDRTADPQSSSSYNFTESDLRFRAVLGVSAQPYFRLGDSWNNADPPEASELDNYAAAAVNVMRHYREGLWDGFTADIQYVEIWNEPEHPQFWPAPLTLTYFFQVYSKIAKALQTALPDLSIGGPGWTPAGGKTQQGQQNVRNFIDYVKADGAPLDFMSWHMYSNVPQDYEDAAAFYRTELDAAGCTLAESHVSEWNTSVDNLDPHSEEALDLRVRARGAALATAFWIKLQEAGVTVSTFYRGNDTAMNLTTFYGLFMADGTPKKVAYAFDLWSDLCRYSNKIGTSVTQNTQSAQIYTIAGQDRAGRIALLASNPGDTAVTYSLAYGGTGSMDLTTATILIYEVSDNETGIASRIGSPDLVTIGGRTVQLLVVKESDLVSGRRRDFSGDGKSDLLWRHHTSGLTALWLLDDGAYSGYAQLGAVGGGWQTAGVGDFNGDGKSDLLWRHSGTGETAMWLTGDPAGQTKWTYVYLGTVAGGWEIQGAADFDLDG
ncbi:MAG: FG-GAP repeat protein, partial [Proteobacteria bacterium]|nr:FG-GAP repeat protein [Pseudomonadota bacterium]